MCVCLCVQVGRLCCALAWESRYLPVLLGAPDAWRAALASTAAPGTRAATAGAQRGAAGSARALAASSKLQAAVHQLRSIGALACRCVKQYTQTHTDTHTDTYRHTHLLIVPTQPPFSHIHKLLPCCPVRDCVCVYMCVCVMQSVGSVGGQGPYLQATLSAVI